MEFAGCVGDDAAGVGLVTELAAAGVRRVVRTVAGAATGTIVSLVELDGQRSMLADRGANLAPRPGDAPCRQPAGTCTHPVTRCSTRGRVPPGWPH